MIPNIVFYITATITILSAVMVILTKDIFRAALFLASTFLGVVGMFILLFAEFLAAVQLIIYVGAISVVILFAIMFTKDVELGNPFSKILMEWQTIIIFISIASMILGAVAAMVQKNFKRLLAYSSIGHIGYALAGVATGSISAATLSASTLCGIVRLIP